ncbi:GTPase IMAP member 4 [Datura stramonium]|uniref:GTPase IMAP member 4 n=1 Tax=Datura stramonium TaxID=4076 RepID=A0ABS8RXK5_DATST|nr:GTPase IMAP member 4 [Datura stramonium]
MKLLRCFDLAKDGIHAVLLVLSVRDDLEDLDVSLDDYLGSNFPDPLEDHDQRAKLDSSSGYSEQEMKELKDQMQRSHEEQIRRIGEMAYQIPVLKMEDKIGGNAITWREMMLDDPSGEQAEEIEKGPERS